jgi:hypothetical protein
MNVKVSASLFLISRKALLFFGSSHASPACPSDNSSNKMQLTAQHWYRWYWQRKTEVIAEIPVTMSLCLPKISHKSPQIGPGPSLLEMWRSYDGVIRFSSDLTVNTLPLYIMTNRLMVPREICRLCVCKGFIPSLYVAWEDVELFTFKEVGTWSNRCAEKQWTPFLAGGLSADSVMSIEFVRNRFC